MDNKTIGSGLRIILISLSIILSVIGCGSQVDSDAAVATAKEFVNSNVRFYTSSQATSNIVLDEVNITIVDVQKDGRDWRIRMVVQSAVNGSVKKNGLAVYVNSQTGAVEKNKISPYSVR
jgi:hypothetical protein